ncbi:hypothetical protein ENH_00014400 [Eimeria necatrix]|uniref:Uncharacterized protein n=1 Tax=Eimeria necatrix TaxID=51315 RepID=U6MED0_9EIME|nr:hypothetical protein ENH_00014400 [Eimeria necatrix]CDJ62386.1 hypothetical protein ENH_00014400 [Eimeria necatrix]
MNKAGPGGQKVEAAAEAPPKPLVPCAALEPGSVHIAPPQDCAGSCGSEAAFPGLRLIADFEVLLFAACMHLRNDQWTTQWTRPPAVRRPCCSSLRRRLQLLEQLQAAALQQQRLLARLTPNACELGFQRHLCTVVRPGFQRHLCTVVRPDARDANNKTRTPRLFASPAAAANT